jgi:hypothetical protein
MGCPGSPTPIMLRLLAPARAGFPAQSSQLFNLLDACFFDMLISKYGIGESISTDK